MRRIESDSKYVDQIINNEREWLLKGLHGIQAEIIFGSVGLGNSKPESDVDYLFLLEDEYINTDRLQIPNPVSDRPGYHLSITVDFDRNETNLSCLRYHVMSPLRVLNALDLVKGIELDKRPLNDIYEYPSENGLKTSTVEEQQREQSWIYQVFRVGKITTGTIPIQINQKLEEVDISWANHQSYIAGVKRNYR